MFFKNYLEIFIISRYLIRIWLLKNIIVNRSLVIRKQIIIFLFASNSYKKRDCIREINLNGLFCKVFVCDLSTIENYNLYWLYL